MIQRVLGLAVLTILAAPLPPAGPSAPAAQEHSDYLMTLEFAREGLLANPTAAEQVAIEGHKRFVEEQLEEGTLVFGGLGGDYRALIVFRAADERSAKAFVDAHKAVSGAAFKASLTPFTVKVLPDPASRVVADPSERKVECQTVVAAPLADAWRAWTTGAGFKAATGCDARIGLTVGGPFEISFDGSAPAGWQGSEGCRVLSWLSESMLSFDWNAPPSFGKLRSRRTHVVVTFDAVDAGHTRIRLTQLGFGKSQEWTAVADYFEKAWPHVLAAMQEHFAAPAAKH